LAYRSSKFCQVEAVKRNGPNVIGFQLVSDNRRYSCVGGYIPPNDMEAIGNIEAAFREAPRNTIILLGDLNMDLVRPHNDRGMEIATMVANLGVEDIIQYFCQKQKHRKGSTWRMQRGDRWIKSRCDYILGTDKRIFKKISVKEPRHFYSDHLMVVGVLTSRPIKENRRYLMGWKKFTLSLGKDGPKTKSDALFSDIKTFIIETTPRPRQWKTWIADSTWTLIDRRAALRRHHDMRPGAEGRRLSWRMYCSIKRDRKKLTEYFGVAISHIGA
jgi:hypothetical protein